MTIIRKPTPHQTKGRGKYKPEAIVLHIMQGTLKGTDAWFNNPKSNVSAHYGIGKNGEVHQYVDEKDTAYHAGIVKRPSWKLFKPNSNPNFYTIGIEHEGTFTDAWTDQMKQASAELVKNISKRWNIPLDRDHVIGHYQINGVDRANCPAKNKSIIDEIIALAKPAPQPEPQPMYPITFKVKIIINDMRWDSLPEKVQQLRDWYWTNSGEKIQIQVDAAYTSLQDIPFTLVDPYNSSFAINEEWYDQHVFDSNYHTTVFVVSPEAFNSHANNGIVKGRTRGFFGKLPTKTEIACTESEMSGNYPELNAFFDYVRHELMHTCYILGGTSIGYFDYTHKYYYDQQNLEKAFSELNFENIYKVIKGASMNTNEFVKTINIKGAVGVVILADKVENYKFLCKQYKIDPKIDAQGNIQTDYKI